MPRFAANIGFLFPDLPPLGRFAAARASGFEAVEWGAPYDFAIGEIRGAIAAAGIRLTGINTPGGDRARGEWGFAGVPGQEARFARDFDLALDYAAALGASMIHVLAGVVPADSRAAALGVYAANIRLAAEKARGAGVMLLLEPINSRDAPGYLVAHCDALADMIAVIAAPNVRLLFDAYHIQIMDGDLSRRFERHQPVIGHVQVAGVPSRNEPDADNELNFPAFFRQLDSLGYDGLVGAEYRPRGRTEDGLGWFKPFAAA
jgi:2-dehydrotetronate isomerase